MGARAVVHAAVAMFVLAGSSVGGCMLFTGSNDGYSPVDAGGSPPAPTVDADCLPLDAGICVLNQCSSSADCVASTGLAGSVCCVGLPSISPPAIGFACEVESCAAGAVPACETSADCEGGACIDQWCPTGSLGLSFKACSLFPGCAIVSKDGGGTGDGGGGNHQDAGPAEAGVDASDAATDANVTDGSDSGD
jgi:hypothetical protein